MELGCFSVSLTVKDIERSKAFYEALGFSVFHGELQQGWLIMKNGETVVGLFQGMFEKNMLTFNPGWNQSAQETESFMDVRDIQKKLKSAGIDIVNEVDESGSGPGSFTCLDPDGNPVLIDQHR